MTAVELRLQREKDCLSSRAVQSATRAWSVLALFSAFGCSKQEPPAVVSEARQIVSARQPAAAPLASHEISPRASEAQAVAAEPQRSTSPSKDSGTQLPKGAPPLASTSPSPILFDEQGRPLPQTEQLPSLSSETLLQRTRLLLAAIENDQPQSADAAFFPLVAYEQVKAIAAPARDHKYRLLAAFHRNIHEYHGKIAKLVKPLSLVSLEPPAQKPKWMEPGSEGNKLGYYRLLRAKLRLTDGNGKEHVLPITSMISWRGEWYVVHLDGFK